MSDLIYLKQDITTIQSEEPILIMHGVNCQRTMGSGVAKALYEKWPVVKSAYLTLPKADMKLGMVRILAVEDNIFVANCWTQEYYGREKNAYASSIHILQCLSHVILFCKKAGIKHIYAPKIGCGLGGLSWKKGEGVCLFFEGVQIFNEGKVQIYICEL